MIGNQIFYRLPLTREEHGGNSIAAPPAQCERGRARNRSARANGFAYGGESAQDQGVDLRHLEPAFRARIDKLMADAAAAGIKTHLTDGYRDNQSQAADYAKLGALGLAARPGSSYHQFGRAVDLVADNPAQQAALVALADQPERGIAAGAHFNTPDRVHFQAAEGKTAPLVGPGETASARPIGQGGIGSERQRSLSAPRRGRRRCRRSCPIRRTCPRPTRRPCRRPRPALGAGFVGPGSDKYSVISRHDDRHQPQPPAHHGGGLGASRRGGSRRSSAGRAGCGHSSAAAGA